MKFWEVLKAVDEGKDVQACARTGTLAFKWFTVGHEEIAKWSSFDYATYNWRIKPEPKTLYVAEQKNGLFFAYESELSAKSCNFDSRKGPIRKFVEVTED